MRILTKKVKAKQLKPGDLFSQINGKQYRELMADYKGVGLAIMVRTEIPCEKIEENEIVYKVIEIRR